MTSLRLELEGPQSQQNLAVASALPTAAAVAAHPSRAPGISSGAFGCGRTGISRGAGADPNNSSAHRELAEIYRRRGKLDEAAQELQLSLAARDSAAVRTMLARIYLEQKKYGSGPHRG